MSVGFAQRVWKTVLSNSFSFLRLQTRRRKLREFSAVEVFQLENRLLLAAAFAEFVDPNPAPGNEFGSSVVPLSNGNVVITSPYDDAGGTDAGAVYLFNGATGALISTLTGSSADDNIGGVYPLANGNYLVVSPWWDSESQTDVGAVTWCNGLTGINGTVSALNSLTGTTAFDQIGSNSVTTLPSGNFVICSDQWDNGAIENAGAVTFGNGATGMVGVVSAENSLVGTTSFDAVGGDGTLILANGNYVVTSLDWDHGTVSDAGAVTWGNGTTGIVGEVSAANSLVGSSENDRVGNNGILKLDNGNYVVSSQHWDNGVSAVNAGAATFGDGDTGVSGIISATNSLVGGSENDRLGRSGLYRLTNGNYLVASENWRNGAANFAGAVTFASGVTGITGFVDATNSLVGDAPNAEVGGGSITVLSNGNYVVRSPKWDNSSVTNVGAVTWCSGVTGRVGSVTAANSLIGASTEDNIGGYGVTALSNGNYVVSSPFFDVAGSGIVDAGAVTWGNGSSGTTGVVGASNSLLGTTGLDQVGKGGVYALSNGHYVVCSPDWDNGSVVDVGAATWLNGTASFSGNISLSNSLAGSSANDRVGLYGVTALTNGNYVVASPNWANVATSADHAGAVTWGNGTTGIVGVVDGTNSLIGNATGNNVGFGGVTPLNNGHYVVLSYGWDDASKTDVGAVTWGNGTSGIKGVVNSANSLIGSTEFDTLGSSGIEILPSGHYALLSSSWDNGLLESAGALTFADGNAGVSGYINSSISAIGLSANTTLEPPITVDAVNGTFFGQFRREGSGRVRVGSITSGFANVAPTSVTFTNTLTSLQENTSTVSAIKLADIRIQDDILGLNVLSLSGNDAAFFQIVGNELRLKPEVNLNFEAKASYTVTVNVDDSNVGATPDASATFTLTLSNVNETPVANDDNGPDLVEDGADGVVNLLSNDTDPDGDPEAPVNGASTEFTVDLNQSSPGIQLSVTNSFGVWSINPSTGMLTFNPANNYFGTATLDYTLSDRAGANDNGSVTFVVSAFNDAPVVSKNELVITEGGTVILRSSNILATDVDNTSAQLRYSVSGVTGGRFELTTNPGVAITQFTPAQMTALLVRFVHDGGESAPAYSIRVTDGSLTSTARALTVTFRNVNDAPVVSKNELVITEGGTVILRSSNIVATDVDNTSAQLRYSVSGVTGGRFELTTNPGVAITQFTPAQMTALLVRFVHDGGESAPAYSIRVTDGSLTSTARALTVTFRNVNDAPVVSKNELVITEGGTVILRSSNIVATDVDNTSAQLRYSVSGVTGGRFELTTNPGVAITQFTPAQMTALLVRFVHDGGESAPAYSIRVTDGSLTSTARALTVTFRNVNDAPVVSKNELVITEGGTVILRSSNILATDVDNTSAQLRYSVSGVTGGRFELTTNPGVAITQFTPAQMTALLVRFVHDGGESAPAYSIRVTDGSLTSTARALTVTFRKVNDAPVISRNVLAISRGATVVLRSSHLTVTDPDNAAHQLTYTASNIAGGRFEKSGVPGVMIHRFTQAEINAGKIRFVHNGTATKPRYSLVVSDGALNSPVSSVVVSFS